MNRLLLITITALLLVSDALAAERPLIGPGSASWQRRRIAGQRATNATVTAPSPVNWWQMESTAGTDSAGSLTLTSGGNPSIVTGVIGNCFTNSGGANKFTRPSVTASSNFTYTFWTALAATNTSSIFLSKGTGVSTWDYMAQWIGSSSTWALFMGTGTSGQTNFVKVPMAISPGTYYFVALGYSTTNAAPFLSVNGAAITWGTNNATPYRATSQINIGTDNVGDYMNGAIDEIKFFTNALTLDQINAVYQLR